MFASRRNFLGSAFALVAAAAAAGAQGLGPQRGAGNSGSGPNDPFGLPSARPKFNPRDLLAANQKAIQKDVKRLSDIVLQLQKQLEDYDTRDVLPLDVIHETEEIQKLAKHINSLVRG